MFRMTSALVLSCLFMVGCPTADPLGTGQEEDRGVPADDLGEIEDADAVDDEDAVDSDADSDTAVDDAEDLGDEAVADGDSPEVPDEGRDLPADANDDGSADSAGGDAPADLGAETSSDTAADVPLDLPTDTATDARADTSPDTTPDTTADTTGDTCTSDCDGPVEDLGECTSGPCCEGGGFLGTEERCGATPSAVRFACEGDVCGSDPLRQYQYQHCTGSSADCGSDNLVWEGWETTDDCEANEICALGEIAECEACSFGCEEGACNPDPCSGISCNTPDDDYCTDADHLMDFEDIGDCALGDCSYDFIERWCDTGCQSRPGEADICNPACNPERDCCNDAGEYRTAEWRCGLVPLDTRYACESSACGADALRQRQFQFCTGSDADCGSSNLRWEPDVYGACDAGDLCESSGSTAWCQSCTYGCSAGACNECTIDDHCVGASWCNSGTCSPCRVDEHCGALCEDCTDDGTECSDDGTTCIECENSFQCFGGWCDGGICRACNDRDHCGPFCWPCGGEHPDCGSFIINLCVCNETSCDPNRECTDLACEVCARDTACEADCVACKDPQPTCVDRGETSECVECTTSDECDPGLVCNAANDCVDPATCVSPPAEACSNGSQSRESCADAQVVSRTEARLGTTRSGDLDDARNNDNRCRSASGEDHFYRIFMLAGETLNATMDINYSTGFDAVLALYYSRAQCLGAGCEVEGWCEDSGGDGSDEDIDGFIAPQDGWYIINADAWRTIDSEEDGSYDLDINLTCLTPSCGC